MKRVLAIVLALLMLVATLVACAQPGDDDVTTTTESAGGTQGTPSDTTAPNASEETTLYVEDNLPEDLNFSGTTISILYWEDVEEPEFEVLEQTGDIVTDGIYMRNLNTETRLGVDLNFVGTLGNFKNQQNFVSTALNSISSGGEHDIFAGYSMVGATLAVNGYAYNLKSLDYLDFDMPWWPDSLISQATINDKLYFASGDISTNMLHMMYAMFFNKQLITDYDLENPYELVESGKWTYEKMFEMASGRYADNNGDGLRDADDAYGFCTADIHYDAFFTGAGLNTVEKDSSDKLIISPSFNSEKTISLLEGICSFMWDGQDGYHGSTGEVFAKGYTIFTLDRSYMGLKRKDEINFEYGIVPVPKFDESQTNYVTCLGFPYTMYAISIASKNAEAAAATLECLASEGYREVTPMLFETSMKLKYSSDNEASAMYDIIRAGVSIDVGRIFSTELQNFSYSVFRNSCVKNAASTWSSTYKAADRIMGRALDDINDAIAELN